MKNFIREIEERIRKTRPHKDPVFIARYVGSVGHEKRKPDEQSRLQFVGLSTSQIRALAREQYSFSDRPFREQIGIWLKLYDTSKLYDALVLALVWLNEKEQREFLLANPARVFRLQKRVDNWAISDGVSGLIADLSERNRGVHLAQLRRWNKSRNPWERRQSLVGLYCYARFQKKPVKVAYALPLVENLLEDRHFFIQKAVGWCLREIHQVDPKAQEAFVSRHLKRLSSAAFQTATEKYSKAKKAALLRRRSRTSS